MATLALTAALILPLSAHSVDQLEAWEDDWTSRAADTQTVDLMDERRDMRSRHEWFFDPLVKEVASAGRTRPPATTPPPTVWPGDWAALVAAYFPPWAVDAAMRVIGCETGYTYDPRAWNRRSGASGLFQQMPRYWAARSSAAGWPGADIFDAEANVAVSAWLWGQTGTWQHWTCKP